MTRAEAARLIDKPVKLIDRRYHEQAEYILRGVRMDKTTGIPYVVLQDKAVKKSYVRARLEDLRDSSFIL